MSAGRSHWIQRFLECWGYSHSSSIRQQLCYLLTALGTIINNLSTEVGRVLMHLANQSCLMMSVGHSSWMRRLLEYLGYSNSSSPKQQLCATFWLLLASHIIWQVCRVLMLRVNQSCWMMSNHLQLIQRLLECWGHSSSLRILPPDRDL